MPDQRPYRDHARMLLQQAAKERDHGRQKYLTGLAASYEALASRHGEPEVTAVMAPAERRSAAVELRGQGLSQPKIAKLLGVCQQSVSRMLQGLD
jgi:hypothetical protein